MRFTIERLRTILLVSGGLLVVALAASLAIHSLKNPFKKIDIPKRLGIDITQEANGVTYRHTFGSHSVFQIHASKVTQLKNSRALLHDVKIELYEQDGSRIDRIEGNEFEYDQQSQVAKAVGPVAITMLRPQRPGAAGSTGKPAPASSLPANPNDEIHVKTSGLVFDQKTGIASTSERVDFVTTQGSGSSVGATYDSAQGHLVLDRQVELSVRRSDETVLLHAQHAEFDRNDMICNLRDAAASFRNGQATSGEARILFRDDGTAVRLDASSGLTMSTSNGGRISAPTGWLEFNNNNQPRRGHLEGGVILDSVTQTDRGERASHGTSPSADLAFTPDGLLQHAHMERGVELTSEERDQVQAESQRIQRTWRSPIADVDFRNAGDNQVEPALLHGTGGVVITGETQRGNGPALPSRLAADDLRIDFGPNSALNTLTGVGHASLEETSASGAHQSSSGDHLDVRFAQPVPGPHSPSASNLSRGAAQIDAASLIGHVAVDQLPAPKPGAAAPEPTHATAGRADYESAGQWMHLTENPRVDTAGLQLAADKIDVSQSTGDAFAHGNVKATWLNQPSPPTSRPTALSGLGGRAPSHVVADEAQMHQSTGEATFRGDARLWQDADSVAAPVIVLNRQRQTLDASSTDPTLPVHVVLLSASGAAFAPAAASSRPHTPTVIRVTGGALHYSDAERKARIDAGSQPSVVAETPTARCLSDHVELILLPSGNHAGRDGAVAQVDTLIATGRVQVSSQGRRGAGAKLVYTSESGDYVLTGTAAVPPRLTDPSRGTVTGEALIFHSRDDSVSIEGGVGKSETQTRTPK